jgi:transcriptional regulator with XRE-family HTH domain
MNTWLRERRLELGIKTQADLAERLQLVGLDVTPGAVSHWENGRYNPPVDDPDSRRKIAEALNWTEPELLKAAGFNVVFQHTQPGHKAASIVDHLPPERQKLALDLLDVLARS